MVRALEDDRVGGQLFHHHAELPQAEQRIEGGVGNTHGAVRPRHADVEAEQLARELVELAGLGRRLLEEPG